MVGDLNQVDFNQLSSKMKIKFKLILFCNHYFELFVFKHTLAPRSITSIEGKPCHELGIYRSVSKVKAVNEDLDCRSVTGIEGKPCRGR